MSSGPKRERDAQEGGGGGDEGSDRSKKTRTDVRPAAASRPDLVLLPVSERSDEARSLKQAVAELLLRGTQRRAKMDRLPGPQPATLSLHALRTVVSREKYWVCEKSDGERKVLCVTKGGAYLLDRSFAVERVGGGFFESVFAQKGDVGDGEPLVKLLVDGELVRSPEGAPGARVTLLLFDAVVADGSYVGAGTYEERLKRIGRVVGKFMHFEKKGEDGRAPFELSGKRVVPREHVGGVLASIRLRQGHYWYEHRRGDAVVRVNSNDGLVFTPDADPYMPASSGRLLKWKWLAKNTVDFIAEADHRRGEVRLVVGGHSNQDWVVRCVPLSEAWRSVLGSPEVRRVLEAGHRPVIECVYDRESGSWAPLCVRPDKRIANFVYTMMSTLEVMVDNVTPRVICDVCSGGRAPCPEQWAKIG